MTSIGIVLNVFTLFVHLFGMFLSFVILTRIIYRVYHNIIYRRVHIPQISSSSTHDNTSLIILVNIYLIFLINSIAWISATFRTFLGDFFLHLGDSTFCRIQVSVLFFTTSEVFYGILIQAIYRYIHITYSREQTSIILCGLNVHHVWFYILLIILSWFISFLILIPAHTTFSVFSYLPKQYHCLVSFSNVRGYIYSIFVCFIVPSTSIFYIYGRLITFVRHLPKCGLRMQTQREIKIISSIFKLCFGITIAGSPTFFFLFQYMITGQLHPLVDRIHEFWVSLNTIAFNIGIAFLNSLFNILPLSYVPLNYSCDHHMIH